MEEAIKILQSSGYPSLDDFEQYLLTDEEKQQFESFIKNNDEAGFIHWLNTN